jgi:hypothetical protein
VPRGTTIHPPIVSELRDVFHTMIDAAGIAHNATLVKPRSSGDVTAFAQEDGKSLLCLLRDPTGTTDCDYPPNPGPWRQWIDMEHSTCYNASNHWSALTDGTMKYIFRANAGDEQLFNLTADPRETMEVSGLQEYTDELQKWRTRMVKQFEDEGRGDGWVKDSKLVKRTTGTTYSPLYPGKGPSPPPFPKPVAGDAVIMQRNGGTADCGTNDCWASKANGTQTVLQFKDVPSFCLSLVSDNHLDVELCKATDAQYFKVTKSTNEMSGSAMVTVTHTPSGQCVSAQSSIGARPGLSDCVANAKDQMWVFGASGRLCAAKNGHLCMRVDATSNFAVREIIV